MRKPWKKAEVQEKPTSVVATKESGSTAPPNTSEKVNLVQKPNPNAPVSSSLPDSSDQATTRSRTASSTQSAPPVTAAAAQSSTLIGESMQIRGELGAAEDLVVSGYLEGTVILPDHTLTVTASGLVNANIRAHSALIEGVVEGDIDCTDSLILRESARVTGNVRMRRLSVLDGASLNGKITMLAPTE